ncbi:MAG: UvrB/UvrC motif-containing protein [Gemmatimonadales bacterium]
MKCDRCGLNESVVSVNHVEGGETRLHHLCAKCAAEKGIQTAASVADNPLAGLIAGLGSAAAGAGSDVVCPSCGTTLQDLKDSGRVGCAACYQAFAEPLRELLRRLHGSAHHTGKAYQPPGGAPAAPIESAANLRERLKRAVEAEEFELAAELRDRLKGDQ